LIINKYIHLTILTIVFVGTSLPTGLATTATSLPSGQGYLPEYSRYFPIWTQGYLEVRKLNQHFSDLRWLIRLIENPSELAGEVSTSAGGIAGQFDEVIQHTLHMTSADFLNNMIGEHFVLGWGGPIMRDQFGLLCRIKNPETIGKFLMANNATLDPALTTDTSQPAGNGHAIRSYRLEQKYLGAVGIDEQILILATIGGGNKASMFHAVLDLARGFADKSLYDNKKFQSACSDLKPNYISLIAIIAKEKNSLTTSQNGLLFDQFQKNVSHIAVAAYPAKGRINIRVNIQPRWIDTAFFPEQPILLDPVMQNMAGGESDFVYLSSIDPYRWYRRIVELAEQGQADAKQYRGMIELVLPDTELRENLLESLGPEIMVVVSSVQVRHASKTKPASSPATQTATTGTASKPSQVSLTVQTMPQVAIVVKTHNPALMMSATEQIFNILAGFVAIHKLTGTGGTGPELVQENYHGLVLHRLDFGSIFPPDPKMQFPGWKLQVAWTQANDYLVISSSVSLIHRLLDRAFVTPADMKESHKIFTRLPDTVHWAMSINPSKVSSDMRLLRKVLILFRQNLGGGVGSSYLQDIPVVLGIGIKVVKGEDQKSALAQVAGVLPGYPAWKHLQVGDVILAVNGRPIAPASPLKDLHKKLATASLDTKIIKMEILRSAKKMKVEIPLNFRNFMLSIQSLGLIEKVLETMSANFNQIDLACTYTADGQVHLIFDFIPILDGIKNKD